MPTPPRLSAVTDYRATVAAPPRSCTLADMHQNPTIFACALALAALACSDGTESLEPDIDIEPMPMIGGPPHVHGYDPFAARLDSASISEVDGGIVLNGFSEFGNVIGTISVVHIGPDMVHATHEYPRPCEGPVLDPDESCADVLHIVVNTADEWTEVWQSDTPSSVFTDRASTLLAELSPDATQGEWTCAVSVAKTSAACVETLVVDADHVVPGCERSTEDSMCECREAFDLAFPDVDWNICNWIRGR